jgi:hypothetical protein
MAHDTILVLAGAGGVLALPVLLIFGLMVRGIFS